MKAQVNLTSLTVLLMIACMAITAPSIDSRPVAANRTSANASTGGFELIGHTPLLNRGMNAGLAVHGNYAHVGSRTDGSHLDAGALVVDISNPARPQVVHQIGRRRLLRAPATT